MKTMKEAFLLALCVLLGTISQVMAQPMNRAGLNAPGIQTLIIEYGDDLNVTDEQKNELIALQIEHRNEFREVVREKFRRDRDGSRGARDLGFRNSDPDSRQARFDSRMELRQEVLDILTEEQIGQLQAKLIEKAEKAHEFRTFRHQYIVNATGIEGEKAEQVLTLLNDQSANRLELDTKRIQNPAEVDRDLFVNHFQQMRDTDDELRSILTVDEYESLRKNLGFSERSDQDRGPRARRWSR